MVLNMEEHKRQAILQKAREWIGANGFSEFTMGKLAEFCGIAKGTLYNYFNSKEGLMVKVVESRVVEIHREVDAILDGSGKPEEKLRGLIRQGLEFYRDNMDLLIVYASEMKIADCKLPSSATAHGRFLRDHLDWFMNRFEQLLTDLGVKEDRRLLAYFFHESMESMMSFNMLFDRKLDIERDSSLLFSFYTKGMEAFL